ncbi:unnamed protein product [Echinostoma caproni]|uniref:Uncharacterized protein n=1 Tax=Echinostoma caproni TaxID=27848 RepID=A0A183B7T9_9TREM|nr:unnamed protein product [Echinostoma caproni]
MCGPPKIPNSVHSVRILQESNRWIESTLESDIILQRDVIRSAELHVVLTEFDKWLKSKKQQFGCCFRPQGTCNWDISQCLWNECKRKRLPVPGDMLNRIDLKALFEVRLPDISNKISSRCFCFFIVVLASYWHIFLFTIMFI